MSATHTYHYLTLNDEIKVRGVYVIGGGMTIARPRQQYPPEDHPQHHFFRWRDGRILTEYQLVYITRGGGLLETKAGGVRSIVAGDLFVLFPGEWHRYAPTEYVGWYEHWVGFRGARVAQIVSELSISPSSPVFRTRVTDLIEREFVRIEEELAAESPGYQGIVSARIELILALAAASSMRERLSAEENTLLLVKRAKTMIIEQLDRPLRMEDVATELQVGYSWFRKTFREIAGVSPGQFQLQIRMARACEFLRSSDLSITDVGTLCGFESAYYFSRIFKKKTGLSPTEFREQRSLDREVYND